MTNKTNSGWTNHVALTIRDYSLLTLGAVLIAVSIDAFLVPNRVVSGGMTGVSTILYLTLGLPVGTMAWVLNIPLLLAGMRYGGGLSFGIRTIYTVTVMSIAIDLLAPFLPQATADPLLYTIFGGLVQGLGVGLIFHARGTAGGTDIVATLVNRFTGIQLGQVILWVNTAVLLAAGVLVGLQPAMYALLVNFVSARVVDSVQEGAGYARAAMIVSRLPAAVRQSIFETLGRGVTVLTGRGGYTDTAQEVLYVVVAKSEMATLKRVVLATDPAAFIVITEAYEVLGHGFKPAT